MKTTKLNNKAFHTDGPWRYVYNGDIRGQLYPDRSSVLIAELSDVNEKRANGRLIAAAPLMLEALELGLELLEQGDHQIEPLEIIATMRDAIRKAKGE